MRKYSYSRMRNTDYAVIVTQIIAVLSKFSKDVLEAIAIYQYLIALQSRQTNISLALDKNKKNPYTHFIDESDEARDNAIDALKYYLLYCIKQPILKIRESADLLISTIKVFGWSMQRRGNDEQTKQMKSLIAEFESRADLQKALKVCKATELFDIIKNTQSSFDVAQAKYNAAETGLKEINPAKEKEFIKNIVDDLILEINYHEHKQTIPEVSSIANELETIFEHINSNIKARVTRNKTSAENNNEVDVTETAE